MYTPRAALEKDFAQKLRVTSHLILYGESGCGKSWLYRSFFANNGVYFKIVNLADASRNNKIAPEILRTVMGVAPQLTGYDEKKAANAGLPGLASGSLEHNKKFAIPAEDPLRQAIREFRKAARTAHAFLVFDNLERIFDKPALMEELADIITLADDPEFLKHGVRFLIVGVPSGVKEYFAKTPSHRTVANRLVELKEVSRLSVEETQALVVKGFTEELRYSIVEAEKEKFIKHIAWVTDRIPQSVHEYCLQLAFLAEESKKLSADLLTAADHEWLGGSLNAAYSVVDGQLNERETRIQRRNQVLYALGQLDADEFKLAQVEAKVKSLFHPNEPSASVGGIAVALGELAGTDRERAPVLRKTPKGDAYMFLDPQYRVCIRAMLYIGKNKMVEKVSSDKI
jgi:hypothetical protein